MSEATEARKALHELIDLLREVDERYLSPEWLIQGPQDTAEGMRQVLHVLQGGLQGWFETDAEHPEFRRIVAPWRKFTGDNADAIYFDAPVRGDRRYRVRGRMDDAVYVSLTIEAGEMFGFHLAWSGNHRLEVEVLNESSQQVQMGEWLASIAPGGASAAG